MLQILKKLNRSRYQVLNSSRRRGLSMLDDVRYLLGERRQPMFFDVGANVGQTTISLKTAFPDCLVHAFEPVETTITEFRQRTARFSGVESHLLALGTQSGVATMDIREYSPTNSLVRGLDSISDSPLRGTREVQVETMDDFCAARGVKSIHLLKTDTEGYDLEVLRGASTMLADRKISLIFSEAGVHSADRRHTSLRLLMSHLEPLGFYLFSLYDLPLRGCDHSGEYFNALFALEH